MADLMSVLRSKAKKRAGTRRESEFNRDGGRSDTRREGEFGSGKSTRREGEFSRKKVDAVTGADPSAARQGEFKRNRKTHKRANVTPEQEKRLKSLFFAK